MHHSLAIMLSSDFDVLLSGWTLTARANIGSFSGLSISSGASGWAVLTLAVIGVVGAVWWRLPKH